MISQKVAFWNPIGWTGWIQLEPFETLNIVEGSIYATSRKWYLLRKVNHQQFKIISEIKYQKFKKI